MLKTVYMFLAISLNASVIPSYLHKSKRFFGDNSVSLGRIWTKLGANSSYKPPRASYTVQGPQKQPEILNNMCLFCQKQTKVSKCSLISP